MDDMDAFERQVAGVVRQVTRLPRPVDAMAIVRSVNNATPRGRVHGMFNIAQFVVAGAVVALFAGLLLTGTLTQPRDEEPLPGAVASVSAAPTPQPTSWPTEPPTAPVTNTDLLPGVTLLTEEVEPGVLRVLNDGVRDLSFDGETCCGGLRTGQDGSVWLDGVESGPIRLGDARAYDPGLGVFDDDADIGPDGTIWSVTEDGALTAFDGESLTRYEAPVGGSIYQVDVTRDGTVWAAWHRGKVRRQPPRKAVVGRLDGKDWRIEAERRWDQRMERNFSNVLMASDDDVWLGLERVKGEPLDLSSEALEGADDWVGVLKGLAPDGTLWIRGEHDIARLDATGLTRYEGDDGVPDMYHFGDRSGLFEVAPDGSLWVTGAPSSCNGGGTLYHFDGTVWTSYGGDSCVWVISAAADGALWFIRGSSSGGERPGPTNGVYVIPPDSTRD